MPVTQQGKVDNVSVKYTRALV